MASLFDFSSASGPKGRCDCSRRGLTCRPPVNYSTPAAAEQFRGDESLWSLAGGVNFISPKPAGVSLVSPRRAETLFLLSQSASFCHVPPIDSSITKKNEQETLTARSCHGAFRKLPVNRATETAVVGLGY